jgi:cyclopropane-fatty-acyl-phospholipid synthase
LILLYKFISKFHIANLLELGIFQDVMLERAVAKFSGTPIALTKGMMGRRTHPVLQALACSTHGELVLRTPDLQLLYFKGAQPGPKAHWQLHDWSPLDDLLRRGEIGFAEGYIAGTWDTEDLSALVMFALANSDALERYFYGRPFYALWLRLCDLWHKNSVSGSRRNILMHYDLGNEFYALWLDKSMTYSCALFGDNPDLPLEDAQTAKYRRILSKLELKPGAHLLEIGCGWGGFMEFAAREGYQITGITISDAQKAFTEDRLSRSGLSHLAKVELEDYRKVSGKFDGVVSIGMFEHVGEKYWPAYFSAVKSFLRPGAKAMVQSITLDEGVFSRARDKRGFIEEVIFPGGCLPSKEQFRNQAIGAGLACRELFAFGQNYTHTLKYWLQRFEAKKDEVSNMGYDEKFIRLWRFYLSSCIAAFMVKRTDVMQAELIAESS